MNRITTGIVAILIALVTGERQVVWGQSLDGERVAAQTNPFRAAPPAAAAPAAAQADDRYAAAPSPVPAAEPATPQSRRARADQALLDARRALSVGDVPRAQQFVGQVEQLRVAYEGPGDSPQAVLESIRQYKELTAIRAAEGGNTTWRQSYARFLVAQADALLGWNDLETATRAANEAAQLNPNYPPGGVTPQDVLRRIKQVREGQATAVAAADPKLPPADAKRHTLDLLAQSRAALAEGDLAGAELLAGRASALNVPDSQFAPEEDRPAKLAADLMRARAESQSVELADASLPATATPDAVDYAGAIGAASDLADELAGEPTLRLSQAPASAPLALPAADEALPLPPASPGGANAGSQPFPPGSPDALLEAGEQALRSGDRAGALESFRAAYQQKDSLDVLSQQRLQGHLQMLQAPSTEKLPAPGGELLEAASAGESVVARQVALEVSKAQSDAKKIRESDPTRSLKMLTGAREQVENSELSAELKTQLLARVDYSIGEAQKYIDAHKSEIELDDTNKRILGEIDRERVVKVEIQGRVAAAVDEFNKLVDEHRYAEAEVVANRLYEMAPEELVAQQINKQAKTIRRLRLSEDIEAQAENGRANIFLDQRRVASEALENSLVDIGYADNWKDLAKRKSSSELINGERGAKELEIEQKLRTPILPRYDETPLSEVVASLSKLTGVNIHLDPRGLSQEAVRDDTPITFNHLQQEITLKSALNLILEPLNLTYTIKDEVLKITSKQIRDGDLQIKAYSVGDLVIPIPNFVPNNNVGLQGLINDAYAAMGAYSGGAPGAMAIVAGQRPGQNGGNVPAGAMAQFNAAGPMAGSGGSPLGGGGPGGLGGAANADFDSLIDLIISTVDHDSWMENGTGEGEIQPFPTNLSLVISQTQRVHEQIADLLEQLRRLQDLQVTIEVRFIRLTDSFFERIGVDFDFNIEDRSGLPPNSLVPGQPTEGFGASATVGLNPSTSITDFPNYTVDLDLPFRQESFGLSEPQFGTPVDVATFGFAILSDIEAFFLIEASQGDRRSNVLQAPKVTLFNGQQAQVIDSAFRPFVISVIPVVGEFAAAQQPVIVVLSEGTMLSVQAVVSEDRRYVRLTLVPFFSQIGEVQEFTFEGTETTSTSSSESTDGQDDESSEEAEEITRSGTTVQLPTFEVISVSTTVSVPDGGTVLLGGIKRLVEGRNEFGVPLLSKIPYVDRLFRNVGIGRETDSLMMMVTPHIIIQEEEEARLGIAEE